MAIPVILNLEELQRIITDASSTKLIVVDFYADWCGPCRQIAPFFARLAEQFRNCLFAKVNVDRSRDISQHHNVRAMPTFLFFKSGFEVHRIQGADERALEETVRRFYQPAESEATEREKAILEQFTATARNVKMHGEQIRKILAKSVIPEDKLLQLATIDGKVNRLVLLRELLNWFKNDFFQWVDSPTCQKCGQQTAKGSGLQGTPTREELKLGASRVEIYECTCGEEVRFPRYNDPAKLLETRNGRCGEWANCFALILAAMDFDQRLVVDVADHVWNEVWIPEQVRWMHVDPCENIMDQPLLYEKGWNKTPSYVVAFSPNHVYDVTWRYAASSVEAYRRRRSVRRKIFISFLRKLNNRQQLTLPQELKNVEIERRILELFQMVADDNKKGEDKNNYGGRTTGDLAWRTQRGEVTMTQDKKNEAVVVVTDEEIAQGVFSFQYSSPTNEYKRGDKITAGFESFGTFTNIERKVENDWKKAYLCRTDGEKEGEIIWQIDISKAKAIKKVTVDLKGNFESEGGSVFPMTCLSELCMKIPKSGHLEIKAPESGVLKITLNLTGGSGSNAFQHAQAVRADLGSTFEPTLSVKIDF